MSSRDYLAARQLDIQEMPARERHRQAWAKMNQELMTFLHEQGPYSTGYPESSARGMWAEPSQGRGFVEGAKDLGRQLGYVAPMTFPGVGPYVFGADIARHAVPRAMNPLYAGLYTMRKLPPWNDPRGYQDYMSALESMDRNEEELKDWALPERRSVVMKRQPSRPGLTSPDPREPGLDPEEATRREIAREILESEIPLGISQAPYAVAGPTTVGARSAVMEMRRGLLGGPARSTGRYYYDPQTIVPR